MEGKYASLVIIDKSNILQLVCNMETKKFHQATYSYNLSNQIPLFSSDSQVVITKFHYLGYHDSYGNPYYQVILEHKDLMLKTVYIVSICQEMQ
jgi:hypothetical protein